MYGVVTWETSGEMCMTSTLFPSCCGDSRFFTLLRESIPFLRDTILDFQGGSFFILFVVCYGYVMRVLWVCYGCAMRTPRACYCCAMATPRACETPSLRDTILDSQGGSFSLFCLTPPISKGIFFTSSVSFSEGFKFYTSIVRFLL